MGLLIPGSPRETIPKLKKMIQKGRPPWVATVGDVVSRETLDAGIRVNLRIIDQMTLRRSIGPLEIKAKRTYSVRNPAGVITSEARDAIKDAVQQTEAVIYVKGEEDLLAIPTILESPDNSLIIYGQPSKGLVVVTSTPDVKRAVGEMMNRMTME